MMQTPSTPIDSSEMEIAGAAVKRAARNPKPAIPLRAAIPAAVVRRELEDTLKLQRAAHLAHPYPTLAERKMDLLKLQAFIRDHRDAIVEAISKDYGNRSTHETLFAEIFAVMDGVNYALKNLKAWMKPQRRGVDMVNFFGARNRVIPQPLGVVGSIVPWNFPINLSFTGLIYVFAAGNRAMVKMSENSRHLTALLQEKIPSYFPKDKLAFFDETGGVGIEFSQLKFDHLMFTGSGDTGRAVMAAAAKNLCPVTLEMGGKSPAIICKDFPLRKAVERILFVKLLNAGQICTTVDHAFVPRNKVDKFVELAQQIVAKRYPTLDTPDYTSVIDAKAFIRITGALLEAQERGATLVQLVPGKAWDAKTRKIAPHLVLNAPVDCALMQREIFGPVLPIIAYDTLDEPINAINAGPRPLALYPFSNNNANVQKIIDHVMSGGVSVNDGLFHVGQHDLPFGGVGDSGMGHYHGVEGFVTFSKMRPVFYQAPFTAVKLLYPPYSNFASKYLQFITK